MNVVYLNEEELDKGIKGGRFYQIFKDDLPLNFAERQYELIYLLEDVLYGIYGEELIFVSDNIWPNLSFGIEVATAIFERKLIVVLLDFLRLNAPKHSIGFGVYDDNTSGISYRGRVFLNLQEIAVEDSLTELWRSRIGETPFI